MRPGVVQNEWAIIETPASSSVVGITPLADQPEWNDYDDLPEGRTMGTSRFYHLRMSSSELTSSSLDSLQAI